MRLEQCDNMRFYESVAYISNSNNNNNTNNSNSNGNISGNTVKTFSSNGNNQAVAETFEGLTLPALHQMKISSNETLSNLNLNLNRNLVCDSDGNDKRKFNDSNKEASGAIDESILNGNENNVNDKFTDLETNINHMITRGNLFKLNFEDNHLNSSDTKRSGSIECLASSPDDSFMDDEDEFSPLPSLNASVVTSEPTYPRGIINPNYPGFQHLAHTLSEHFFDHPQFGNMSDSDVSEFESDFSTEKQTQNYRNSFNLTNTAQNRIKSNTNPFSDSNGNDERDEEFQISNNNLRSSNHNSNNNNHENLSKVEEILRTVFESNSSHLTTAIEMLAEHEYTDESYNFNSMETEADQISIEHESINENINDANGLETIYNCNTEIIECDLKTYLKHYDDEAGVNLDVESIMKKTEMKLCDEPPPDIIQKSNSSYSGFDSNADKPDILQNVIDKCENDAGAMRHDWGITPVDIVGNFEQEVERELGLLVTGYKNHSSDDLAKNVLVSENKKDKLESSNGNMMEKITDAVLSNANEIISVNGVVFEENTCDKPNAFIYRNSRDFDKNPFITKSDRFVDEQKQRNQIPTAIVKPKYQKSSFDDRQLPAVAYVNRDQPWYDKCIDEYNTPKESTITVTSATIKKIHLPEFDRKAKKHLKSVSTKSAHLINNNHTNSNSDSDNKCSAKEHSKRMDVTEKDTDCSCAEKKRSVASVAIVQPRKKEKMNERELMEKIVKMQIKKNSKGANRVNPNADKNVNQNIISNGMNQSNGNSNKNQSNTLLKNNVNDQKDAPGCFDVYNIETALPVIDLEAIENHLKIAKEEERRKRNDREEIRRRLAMGAEDDYLTAKIQVNNKPSRKPSLHSRLQGGMNLQICFMNESAAEAESPSSDSESCPKLSKPITKKTTTLPEYSSAQAHPYNARPLSVKKSSTQDKARPTSLKIDTIQTDEDPKEIDFFTKQARLQIEARMALAQAKDMAHMQMEMERQKQKESPITGIIRKSVEKVGINFPAEKRRVSRQMLTDMNVAQLQIIVNDFHSQIENLNEQLVKYLMDRDDLHMTQDSMLVDIEDLTRYLGAKKDPYYEHKKTTKRFHSMKSPKYPPRTQNQRNNYN